MAFDFPSSPSEGQVFNAPGGPSYVFNSPLWRAVGQGQIAIISDAAPANPANGTLWLESDTGLLFAYWNDGNSSQWVQVGGNAATGAIVTTVWTVSGTYTKPVGLRYLDMQLQGCGGGAGGAVVTVAAQYSGGVGGGAGGYTRHFLSAASVPATLTITLGAFGAGGNGAGVNGGNGGTSTITGTGVALSCTGGNGGVQVAAVANTAYGGANGASGQSGSGGNVLNVQGQSSDPLIYIAGVGIGLLSRGGSSMMGGAGVIAGNANGVATVSPGAGGSGSGNGPSQPAHTGGAGGPAVAIFTEYF